MAKKLFQSLLVLLLATLPMMAQTASVTGRLMDTEEKPIAFATVLLFEVDGDSALQGAVTEEDGTFRLENLQEKTYKISFSYVGFVTKEQEIVVAQKTEIESITLQKSTEALDEAVVTARNPSIEKKPGKLIFNVENTSLSTGSTFDLLKKTPGVVVIGEEIKIKFSNPVIYINNKRVYLSSSEVVSLLQNTNASTIKSVEVITNPSAQYDGATGTVLNINTSRAISIGYKGSVDANYTQGVFPKYRLGTSHFYKNDWLNFYGSYSFNKRKDFKEDENFVRYFEPDGSTNSIWNSDFNRITHTNAHQGNLIVDFTINEKQTLSLATTFSVNPNETYDNRGFTTISNPQQVIDSTFTTLSDLESDTHTFSATGDYKILLDDQNSNVTLSANYTDYNNGRDQNVATAYNDPSGTLLRRNSFSTDADQGTSIFTGQADLNHKLWEGTMKTGLKYSNIDSDSKLDFFDTDSGVSQFNSILSDDFNYLEKIYASYINFERDFEKFSLNADKVTLEFWSSSKIL